MCVTFPLILTFDFQFLLAAKAIDRYIQTQTAEQSGSKEKIDPRLQATIEGIFNRCIAEGEYKQVASPFYKYLVFLLMILTRQSELH